MITAEMSVETETAGTLEDLLAAWAPHDHTAVDGVCMVCAGETLRVELRSGAAAHACRECGSVLEIDAPGA